MKVMVGLLITALALCGGAALAGDWHNSATLVCSDCHTMHFSAQHGYDGVNPIVLGATGPNENLIKAPTRNELCLTCHDGSANAPDVYAANTGTHVRNAGALNKLGDAGAYADYKGHTLGALASAPGGTWTPDPTTGITCGSCHSTHGSTYYRNMKNKPGGSADSTYVTYAIGTNDLTKDVFERDATLGQVATHYDVANVDFNEPDSTKSAYANWCKSCHTNFHGVSGGTEVGGASGGDISSGHGVVPEVEGVPWHRHPSADVNIGQNSNSKLTQYNHVTHVNKVKVMSNSGDWGNTSTDVTPSCFSCHKSHGNQNAFGLIHMSGTGTLSEQGDDGSGNNVRGLCRQCHSQGT